MIMVMVITSCMEIHTEQLPVTLQRNGWPWLNEMPLQVICYYGKTGKSALNQGHLY